MRPLADALVHIGADVFVPDWEWTAPDWGRGELLASLASAATVADNRPLIVIGWSLGGTAALSLASLAHYEVTALVGLAPIVKRSHPSLDGCSTPMPSGPHPLTSCTAPKTRWCLYPAASASLEIATRA